MRISRLIAAALAGIVCVGFALGVRQAINVNRLESLLTTPHWYLPARQRTAAALLRAAAFGYPGQDVALLAARVSGWERHFARVRAIARSITRAEPDNLQGWVQVAVAGILVPDRAALRQARNEEIRLDPQDAGPR